MTSSFCLYLIHVLNMLNVMYLLIQYICLYLIQLACIVCCTMHGCIFSTTKGASYNETMLVHSLITYHKNYMLFGHYYQGILSRARNRLK